MLVLSSGESSLFVIGSLSVDTVFYKEVFGEILVYISGMKLNLVPENNMQIYLIKELINLGHKIWMILENYWLEL